MISLEPSNHLQPRHRVLFVLFSVLFLLAPFYYQDNLGGEGLSLPFNAVIWVPVVMLIGAGLWALLATGRWVKAPYLGLLLLFPAGVLLSGFVSGMERPGEWVIRLGVLCGGMLLWFALLQFRMQRRDTENLLYLLLAGMLLHAMVGLLQLVPEPLLKGWIPVAPGQKLLGMFQQPNLQASLMATATLLSVYLASMPSFKGQKWPMKSLVVLTLLIAPLQVVASGSRVGLIGASLGLVLLALARLSVFKRRWGVTLVLASAIAVGAGLGFKVNDGALRAYNKIEQLAEAGADARPHIYRIAFDVFQRAPLFGHGIGSFQREFQDQRVPYADQHDATAIAGAPRFSHPHNELLFWMDEGGAVALGAILLGVLAVALQLYRQGWQRGGAIAALMLPIALHTQVELPFYISTLHWLVLIVLLMVCFTPGARVQRVRLSLGARRLISGSVFVVVPLVSVFLTHSLLAQTGIMQYLKTRGAQPVHLNHALNNLYFREMGEYFTMRAVLYSDIQQGLHTNLPVFIEWAQAFLTQLPDIQIYRDLAVALQYEGRADEAVALITRASQIYPGEKMLADTYARLIEGEPLVPSVGSLSASSAQSVD